MKITAISNPTDQLKNAYGEIIQKILTLYKATNNQQLLEIAVDINQLNNVAFGVNHSDKPRLEYSVHRNKDGSTRRYYYEAIDTVDSNGKRHKKTRYIGIIENLAQEISKDPSHFSNFG